MNDMVNMLKNRDYQIPRALVSNYKNINMTDMELILIMCILNEPYNPKAIAKKLDLKLTEVLELINSLSEKGILKIELRKINNIAVEYINLDGMYEKLSLLLMGKNDKESSSNIYDKFETELGRTLSPMEYEIVNGWLKDNPEEIIVLALKEAIYNGVSNFRYIDRIVHDWNKKGLKTKEDVENSRKQFKHETSKKNIELFDYDWLNDEGSN